MWIMLCKLAFMGVKSLYGDVFSELQESQSGKCTLSIPSFAFAFFTPYFHSLTNVKEATMCIQT